MTTDLARPFSGTVSAPTTFGAGMNVGVVDDPLEGIDDCGVARMGNVGTGGDTDFTYVDEAVLIDQALEVPLMLNSAATDTYFPYHIDLRAMSIEPRHGQRYGFRAKGGTWGGSFATDQLRLPEALSFPLLEARDRLERRALPLTWTGRGEAPLRIVLFILGVLADSFDPYTIECLVEDDGEFTIPANVMAAAPDGFVRAQLRRDERQVLESGSHKLLAIGVVERSHQFALGASCSRGDVMQACQGYADRLDALYAQCGWGNEAPPRAFTCPGYLDEACGGCPEYYACMRERVACQGGFLVHRTGCSCGPASPDM